MPDLRGFSKKLLSGSVVLPDGRQPDIHKDLLLRASFLTPFLFRFITVCLIATTLFSCRPNKIVLPAGYRHFDTRTFFSTEIEVLKNREAALNKLLVYNDSTESVFVEQPDWEREFAPFVNLDLNNAGYYGKYSVDSNMATDSLSGVMIIQYSALDDRLPMQQLEIQERGGKVLALRFSLVTENPLYTLHRQIIYSPGNFYRIDVAQDVRFMEENFSSLEGRFEPPGGI